MKFSHLIKIALVLNLLFAGNNPVSQAITSYDPQTIKQNLTEALESSMKTQQLQKVGEKKDKQQDFGAIPPPPPASERNKIADSASVSAPTNMPESQQGVRVDDPKPPYTTQNNGRENIQQRLPKKKFEYSIPDGAKIVKLGANNSLAMLKDEIAIVTFPFLISRVEYGTFVPRKEKEDKDRALKVEVRDNQLVLRSKTAGDIDYVVYGGDYPVIVTAHFNNDKVKSYSRYYAFVKPDNETKKAKKLTSDNHEETVIALNQALYFNYKLDGFKVDEEKKFYESKELNLQLIRERKITGKGYVGEVWLVSNVGDTKMTISEEIFNREGTYSVALLNYVLEPQKTTTMFIVRKQ